MVLSLGFGLRRLFRLPAVERFFVFALFQQQRDHGVDFHALAACRNQDFSDRAFIDRFPPRSVAVWGAGHQALAALALGDLGGAIRYVVDSAPFKQNRFTPATHLPIVPPARLADDPPAAIIVMAASYSDEVVRLIREHHRLNLPVAILRPHGLEHAGPARALK